MSERYNPLKSLYHPLKHLAVLRYGFLDEIPPQVIHSFDRNNLYKVRGCWWASVQTDLENAIEPRWGLITDPEIKDKAQQFIVMVQKLPFGDDADPACLRTAADIAWANGFIDSVLAATGYADTPLDLTDLDSPAE